MRALYAAPAWTGGTGPVPERVLQELTEGRSPTVPPGPQPLTPRCPGRGPWPRARRNEHCSARFACDQRWPSIAAEIAVNVKRDRWLRFEWKLIVILRLQQLSRLEAPLFQDVSL